MKLQHGGALRQYPHSKRRLIEAPVSSTYVSNIPIIGTVLGSGLVLAGLVEPGFADAGVAGAVTIDALV